MRPAADWLHVRRMQMPQNVAAEFEQASTGWMLKLQADEWFFARLRARLVETLAPFEAFDAIVGAAELILRESDSYLRSEEGNLLIDLVRRSETTELPAALAANWDAVRARLPKVQADELACWYRKASPNPPMHRTGRAKV